MHLSLRAINMALGMAWGFALTWVLIRAVGVDVYARYVLTAALGLYLSAAHLGVPELLYSLLRQRHVQNQATDDRRSVTAALTATAGVAMAAVTIYAVALLLSGTSNALPLILFFASVASYLPWHICRAVLEAVEAHVFYEAVDAIRRALQLATLFAILSGTAPATIFALHLVLWAGAFAAALTRLHQHELLDRQFPDRSDFKELYALLKPKLGATVQFSLSELFIYNGPYLLIPLLYQSAGALVLFDLFNKVFRAGINANIVLSTWAMPQLTRAWHLGDVPAFERGFRRLLGLSMLAMLTGASLLIAVGAPLLSLLVDGEIAIGPALIIAICIGVIGNAALNSIGATLVRLGEMAIMRRLAMIAIALQIGLYVVAHLAGIGVETWLVGFASLYLGASLLWLVSGQRHLAALAQKSQH